MSVGVYLYERTDETWFWHGVMSEVAIMICASAGVVCSSIVYIYAGVAQI